MKWLEIILVQEVAGWLDVRMETLFCNTHGDREAVGSFGQIRARNVKMCQIIDHIEKFHITE